MTTTKTKTMARAEYEALLLKATKQIHLLGCWHSMQGEPCAHPRPEIWQAEAMQADAVFQVLFDHFGLQVPPEEPGEPETLV
jgi:hypothetical protein